MGMPADLILVRHGESEGNVAVNASKRGDERHYTDEFMEVHSSRWRLSPRGVKQAELTGHWLRSEFPQGFDRYYTSEFARAIETAAHLSLDNAEWLINPYLRERWRGDLDRITQAGIEELAARVMKDRSQTPYYWRPPGGESLVDVCARLRLVLGTLHRECDGRSAIVVCHGEVMEAFRIELERMSEHEYLEWDRASDSDPTLKIKNTQVWHYTRRDPASGELAPHLGWRRSCVPSAGIGGPWVKINRRKYSNEELLALAEQSQRLLDLPPAS